MNKPPFKNLGPQNIKKSKPAGISDKVINILKAYTLISRNKYPSVRYLAEELEVKERTVYRYLEIINMIDSIEFDRERKGYKFMNGDLIKKLILSDEEFLLLLVMGETVSHLGEPFKEEFRKLTDSIMNIKKTIPDKSTFPIVVKIPDAIRTEKLNTYFKALSDSIKERRSIEIIYRGLYSRKTSVRMVDPYGLVFYEGAWILIGYCHLREKIRHFALDRIIELKESRHYFDPIDNFNIEDHFAHSWGIYDNEDVNVTLRFSSKVAEHITRRDKWHQSEKRKLLPSGEVELSFTVAGVEEIKKWIYSWIPDVEVIKPEWLRKQVKKELAGALKVHS